MRADQGNFDPSHIACFELNDLFPGPTMRGRRKKDKAVFTVHLIHSSHDLKRFLLLPLYHMFSSALVSPSDIIEESDRSWVSLEDWIKSRAG